MVWDKHPIHRRRKVKDWLAHHSRIHVYEFPTSRDRGLFVSVIHTPLSTEAYQLPPGGTAYEPAPQKRGKLNGYLRNVALTKVLLTNERWPFVLATPLHADLTIAIDVLYHTASFTLIGKTGPDIRTVTRSSTQKERLGKTQVRQVLIEILRQEAKAGAWESACKQNPTLQHAS